MIQITADTKQIQQAVQTLKSIPGAYEKAAHSVMWRVVQSVRQEAVNQTRDKYWITAGRVRKAFYVRRSDFGGEIRVSGSRVNLKDYKLHPGRPPKRRKILSGAVKKTGGLKAIPRSFLIPRQGSYYGFERIGRGRDAIRSLVAPAVPQIVGNDQTIDAMTQKAQETFEKRMQHEMMRAIGAVR